MSLTSKHSILTTLMGRRRVGKTTIALQSYSQDAIVYFFVSKKDEYLLCEEFAL